jgi:hypothetical protein
MKSNFAREAEAGLGMLTRRVDGLNGESTSDEYGCIPHS